jgi:hypothetical protein
MEEHKKHLDNISEIKNLMEKSTRFISLSGLSGVFAGIWALLGAVVAYYLLEKQYYYEGYSELIFEHNRYGYVVRQEFMISILLLGAIILALAGGSAYFFSYRKSRKMNMKFWNKVTFRLLTNLMIPLATGGIFCLILLYRGEIYLVAPATLIFYGLALVNASKYTMSDIRYLGVMEIALGLISTFYVGYGLITWAIGFGVLHIIYGSVMYFKYDR